LEHTVQFQHNRAIAADLLIILAFPFIFQGTLNGPQISEGRGSSAPNLGRTYILYQSCC